MNKVRVFTSRTMFDTPGTFLNEVLKKWEEDERANVISVDTMVSDGLIILTIIFNTFSRRELLIEKNKKNENV